MSGDLIGGLAIVYLALVVLGIVIIVTLLRWVLRINTIVSELKAIREALGREGAVSLKEELERFGFKR